MERILITGANRGIGLELTRQLLQREDTQVFATCRKPDEATALNDLQAQYGDRLSITALDVISQESIGASLKAVSAQTNALDVIINNAAINPPGEYQTFDSITVDGLQFMFHVNSIGPLMVVKAYVDLLKKGDNPRILNISTQMGSLEVKTSGGFYGYTSSKAALNMISRAMAWDLAPRGITTAMIHPGWVQTDMGGPNASLTPEQSATGVLRVLAGLSSEQNGMFFQWDGTIHPW